MLLPERRRKYSYRRWIYFIIVATIFVIANSIFHPFTSNLTQTQLINHNNFQSIPSQELDRQYSALSTPNDIESSSVNSGTHVITPQHISLPASHNHHKHRDEIPLPDEDVVPSSSATSLSVKDHDSTFAPFSLPDLQQNHPPSVSSRSNSQHQSPQHQSPQHQPPQHQSPQHQSPQHQSPQHQSPQHQPPQHQSPSNSIWEERRQKVIDAFRHSWQGYKQYAFGADELCPVSRTSHNDQFRMALTLVDGLDTAILMGLDDVVKDSYDFIEHKIDLHPDFNINLFETTIRILGGFLSAYALKPQPFLLERAKELADGLILAFEQSPTKVPYSDVNLRSRTTWGAPGGSSTSEATTVQLEFKYLSHLLHDDRYRKRVEETMEHVQNLPQAKQDGIVPIFISPHSGQFSGQEIRLGSRGDSYYEYLLKQWVQTNQTQPQYRQWYDHAADAIEKHLIARTSATGLTFVGELPNGVHSQLTGKMDHLVCFLPAILALGATMGKTVTEAASHMNERDHRHFQLAEEITETCYETYARTATGLSPEIFFFHIDHNNRFPARPPGFQSPQRANDYDVHGSAAHNLLRPETVESLFYLYRMTHHEKYREWGWRIFEAFETHTKIPTGGYSSISDVTQIPTHKRDKMESFWLAETLKYLFLLFSDDHVIPLDQWVFNTEAHPFPIIPH